MLSYLDDALVLAIERSLVTNMYAHVSKESFEHPLGCDSELLHNLLVDLLRHASRDSDNLTWLVSNAKVDTY